MSGPETPAPHPDAATVEAVHQLAVQQAESLCRALRAAGWDFVCVQISRAVHLSTGEIKTMGAALFDAAGERIGPALPQEARALRTLADRIDQEFARLGCPEAPEAYCETREL